jgi:hypothetical protein
VIAKMLVVREVLEAFKALQEPSGEELDLVSRSRTVWFEAGAFSLFRDRAMLLLRITREVDRVTEILLEGPATVKKLDLSIEAATGSLKAAQSAFSRGDLDAALLHSRGALRGVLESLPFIAHHDERLLAPGAFLAKVSSLREYAAPLCLLDTQANALSKERADVGIAMPLLDGLLPVVASIVHEPPIIELQAIVAAA